MSESLHGNGVVAQSGGPTPVSNASACGVIQEAFRYPQVIENLYGANNGILGIVQEDFFDLRAESPDNIEGLRHAPSSALGSCRYRLGDPGRDPEKYERLLQVLRAHDVRYLFYIGGNDSMDTADKVASLAAAEGYDLRVVGVPKAIGNDLTGTDHSPGYGSVAKYLATSVMEAGRDTEAMWTFDPVTIAEVMGRNTGWIAAAAGLAGRREDEAPHLIYVPEIPFSVARFLEEVGEVHRRLGRVFVVVGEGVVDSEGRYIAAQGGTDPFGQRQPGGVACYLQQLVLQETGLKGRYNKLDTCQRNAMHFASRTDSEEAYLCGQEAVRQALAGTTGFMVSLRRQSGPGYACGTGLTRLSEAATGVKHLPREYLNVAGTGITEAMRAYARPLLRGEVPIRIGPDGLPEYVRLERKPVPKKLPPFLGHK